MNKRTSFYIEPDIHDFFQRKGWNSNLSFIINQTLRAFIAVHVKENQFVAAAKKSYKEVKEEFPGLMETRE